MTEAGSLEVRAEFDNLATAQEAIAKLGRAGVEGRQLTVEKNPVAAAAESTVAGQAAADDKLVRKAAGGAGRGALVGAGVGAVLGAILGLVLFGVRAPTVGLAVCGGVVFGLLGFVLGGYTSMDVSPAWEATIQGGEGPAQIVVVCQTAAEEQLATSALTGAGGRVLR